MTDQTTSIDAAASAAQIAATTGAAPAPAAPASWRDTLPEDMREQRVFQKYANQEEALRALVAAQPLLGAPPDEILRLPKAGDPDAARKAMEFLGLPQSVDEYKLATPGMEKDAISEAFRQAAFKAGVLPGQMNAVYEAMTGYLKEVEGTTNASVEEQATTEIATLQRELGATFNDVVTRADIAAREFGLTDALNAANLGTNPGVIRMLAAAYPAIAEDKTGGRAELGSGAGAKTPAQYTDEAQELTSRAMRTSDRGEQARLIKQAVRLRELANA